MIHDLTDAKRREWIGMGVAGLLLIVIDVDYSLIPYVYHQWVIYPWYTLWLFNIAMEMAHL